MSEYFDYSAFEEISPEIIEKQKIRRSANACGLGLIALFAIMYFWSFVYVRLSVILGLPVKTALNFASDPFSSQLIGIVVSGIMVVLPFFVVALSMGLKFSTDISFKRSEKGLFLPCLLLGIAFCLFSSFATAYGGQIFTIFGIELPSADAVYPKGLFGIAVAILSTAFFPAFLEELALRGFVLGVLRRGGDTFAIVCSAVVFGFMHANFDQIVFAFLVGLVLGFITVKTGSVWCAIAVHFANNLNSVIITYLSDREQMLSTLLLVVLFTLVVLLGVGAVIILQKRQPEFFKLSENTVVPTFKKIRLFLTAPAIIISIIISLLIAYFAR